MDDAMHHNEGGQLEKVISVSSAAQLLGKT
jgi:hypothetical protein